MQSQHSVGLNVNEPSGITAQILAAATQWRKSTLMTSELDTKQRDHAKDAGSTAQQKSPSGTSHIDKSLPEPPRGTKRRRLDEEGGLGKLPGGSPVQLHAAYTSRRPSWEMEDIQYDHLTPQPMSKSAPARVLQAVYSSRRRSWVMEDVHQDGWNYLIPEEQQSVLCKYNIPPEATKEVFQFGNQAHITINIQELEYFSQRAVLYHDVEGRIPSGHAPLTERDVYNIPYGPLDHEQEMERGYQLSRKPIYNAPAWTKDLPWDEMDGITFEEFIIYFPNHVARWPGLALWLRHQSWDRLFYRTARLINLARGSHNAQNRDHQHVEVLPMMMKVERAIQEIAPQYKLADHEMYDEQPTKEWFIEHIRDKPANFPPHGIAGTVTLEEAAGYITGINEFQDREFSRRARRLQPKMPQVDSHVPGKIGGVLKFPFANAFDEGFEDQEVSPATHFPQRGSREQRQNRDKAWYQVDENTTGWINPDLNIPMLVRGGSIFPRDSGINFAASPAANAYPNNNATAGPSSPAPPTVILPDFCPLFEDCDDMDCQLDHAWNVAAREKEAAQARTKANQDKIKKVDKICRDHLSCAGGNTCKFLHKSNEGYQQALVNQAAKQFRDDGHASGRNPGNGPQQQNNSEQQRGQNNGSLQQPSCQTGHQQQANNHSNTQQQNSEQPRPGSLCRHGANCNNANCPFGHCSPSADGSIEVNLEQVCRFGASCTNTGCNRSHPSPASAQQGQGGGQGGNSGIQPRIGRQRRRGRGSESQNRGGNVGQQRGGSGNSIGASYGDNKNHNAQGKNGSGQSNGGQQNGNKHASHWQSGNGQGRGWGNHSQGRGGQLRGGRGGNNVPQRGGPQQRSNGPNQGDSSHSRGGINTRGGDRGRGGGRGRGN